MAKADYEIEATEVKYNNGSTRHEFYIFYKAYGILAYFDSRYYTQGWLKAQRKIWLHRLLWRRIT